ncbi:hypothetical protein SDC9_159450 [bioreactor metagenome]|uniref:Uncharacterized protein n=1 Tax=bioreactor metagenome TaxID=1076179 RepID=A0A645FCN2_9ZZZZ
MSKCKIPYYGYAFFLKAASNRNRRTQGKTDINGSKRLGCAPDRAAHVSGNSNLGYAEEVIERKIRAVLADRCPAFSGLDKIKIYRF